VSGKKKIQISIFFTKKKSVGMFHLWGFGEC
jgi:hypothetical protein